MTTKTYGSYSKEIGRQVCETVFGGIPEITRCTFWGEVRSGNHVMDGNEGKWEVIIEAGMGLTGIRSREDFQVFETEEEAEAYAAAHSEHWSHSKLGSRLHKGSRV